jgi:F-type H+-transporting ATPase subunit b
VKRKKWAALAVLLLSLLLVFGLTTACYAAEGEIPPFGDWYKIGWTAVNFFVLLAFLYKFGFQPVSQMIDERTNTIEGSLRHAEEVKVDVERMHKEAQTNLGEARREAAEIVARATKLAEDTKTEIVAKAQHEAQNERTKAVAEINSEKDKALAEIRDTAATLAIMAAEKVLGRAITEEDHKAMAKKFVDEAGDMLC